MQACAEGIHYRVVYTKHKNVINLKIISKAEGSIYFIWVLFFYWKRGEDGEERSK